MLGRRLNHHATARRRHTLSHTRQTVTARIAHTHAVIEDVQTGCAQTHPRRVRARVAHHIRDRLTQNPGEQLRVHASHRERALRLRQFGANTGSLQGTTRTLNLTREIGHAQARHG